jgi:hypothetical protein
MTNATTKTIDTGLTAKELDLLTCAITCCIKVLTM